MCLLPRAIALAVAEGLGYRRRTYDLIAAEPELKYNYALIRQEGAPIKIEIHWRLLESGKLNWFWQPRQIVRDDAGFSQPSAEAHLLYLCAHALLQHGEEEIFLRHIFDLHRLIMTSSMD